MDSRRFASLVLWAILVQNEPPIRVKFRRIQDETLVLCLSRGRKEKDNTIREKQEARLLRDLVKLEKRIAIGRHVKTEKIGETVGMLKERYPV